MAFVVSRSGGRFEVRESIQSPRGPRARSLANFAVLTTDVLRRAEARASRPFDASGVLASAVRCGAPVDPDCHPTARTNDRRSSAGFVDAARRFAASASTIPTDQRADSGTALAELIGFAEEVARGQPRRPVEPLGFPPLSTLGSGRTS